MAETSDVPISPVGVSKPELTVSAASVNNEAVELDSTPTSPEKVRGRRGSKVDLSDLSPEEREVCTLTNLLEGACTDIVPQRREKIMHERKADPAVLVDIPQTPGAEEFGRSEDAEATVSDKTVNTASS